MNFGKIVKPEWERICEKIQKTRWIALYVRNARSDYLRKKYKFLSKKISSQNDRFRTPHTQKRAQMFKREVLNLHQKKKFFSRPYTPDFKGRTPPPSTWTLDLILKKWQVGPPPRPEFNLKILLSFFSMKNAVFAKFLHQIQTGASRLEIDVPVPVFFAKNLIFWLERLMRVPRSSMPWTDLFP